MGAPRFRVFLWSEIRKLNDHLRNFMEITSGFHREVKTGAHRWMIESPLFARTS